MKCTKLIVLLIFICPRLCQGEEKAESNESSWFTTTTDCIKSLCNEINCFNLMKQLVTKYPFMKLEEILTQSMYHPMDGLHVLESILTNCIEPSCRGKKDSFCMTVRELNAQKTWKRRIHVKNKLRKIIYKFLVENIPKILKVGTTTASKTAKIGAKSAAKTGIKATLKGGAKTAAKTYTKAALKGGAKTAAKTGIKAALKGGAKTAAKTGTKTALKSGAKTAAKTSTKAALKGGAKTATKAGTIYIAQSSTKAALKSGAKTVVKTGSKTAVKTASKTGIKTVLKIVATPVAIISDVTQGCLEMAGYEKTGKAIGAGGNVASGAMVGFGLGGPVGALLGITIGGGVWLAGEGLGLVIDHLWNDTQENYIPHECPVIDLYRQCPIDYNNSTEL